MALICLHACIQTLLPFYGLVTSYELSLHARQEAHQAGAIVVSVASSDKEYFYSLLDGIVHRRGYSQH